MSNITPLPLQPENDYDRARIMTSNYPPTNTHLLMKWLEETKDDDLKILIQCWTDFVEGKLKSSFEFYDQHQKIVKKFGTDQ